MRAANRIEGCIEANSSLAPCGEPAHSRDEVASAIVDIAVAPKRSTIATLVAEQVPIAFRPR